MTIDLNCDLGEGAGHDAELMPLISSANIACGAHAGDDEMMRETIALAKAHGVAIGAHPGFVDRDYFGRRELPVTGIEVAMLIRSQFLRLQEIARLQGAGVRHLKLHGALYNQASRDPALANAVCMSVRTLEPHPILFVLAGSVLEQTARAAGLRVASEVFADRMYCADGSLLPRTQAGAVIVDAAAAAEQVFRIVTTGRVRTVDATDAMIRADTICLHGDGPNPVELATILRQRLQGSGIVIQAPGS